MSPQFSIIITSHLRPFMLARALRSLELQECADLEVIVAMDAWCAASIDIVNQSYIEHKKLLVLPCVNGPSVTRNEAKRHAVGRWVIFLDDDDQLLPTFLQDLRAGGLDEVSIIWTNYVVQQELIEDDRFESLGWREMTINQRVVEELEVSNFIPNSALVYPRAMLRDMAFDPHLSSLEDWDFVLQAKRQFPMRPIPVFGPVISMPQNRLNRNSRSQQSQDHFMDILHIYRKWRSDNQRIRELRLRKINGRHLRMSEKNL
jgi:glycosyltransferase involved in cell wall biosynthesis